MANDFLSTYAPLANDIATRTGVDPSVILGIIDTETGGGQHVVGNNIFGISPSGPQGQYVARYPDVQTAADAFINLMQTPRYRGVAAAGGPASQSAALVRGGYNTANPQYASIVANKALSFGKQLGYQDNTSGGNGAQDDVPIVAAATPAAQPAAPAQPPTSEVDKALADPALQPSGAAPSTTTAQPPTTPAQPPATTSEVDKALTDPALQPSGTATDTPPAGGAPEDDPAFKSRLQGVPGVVRSPSGMVGTATTTAPATGTSLAGMSQADIVNALQPAPNTIYGSPIDPNLPMGGNPLGAALSPFARDVKTGETRLTLPPVARSILLGLAGGAEASVTINPNTGTINVTPEAASVAQAAANPLRFSGPRPTFVPPGTLDEKSPPLSGVNALTPEAAAQAAEHPAGPSVTAPTAAMPPGVTPSVEYAVPPTEKVAPAYSEPSAVGADVTRTPIPEKDPAQRLRDLQHDVTQTAEDRAGPQMVDHTQYVTGIPGRMTASREFHPQNALDEKVGRAQDQAFRNEAEGIERERNMGMVDLLRTDAGDPISMGKLHDYRSEASPHAMGVFKDEQPVDASGMLKAVDDVLNGPEGKRGAVRTVFNDVRNSLLDADGNLETDPSRLYGARKNVTDLLAKGAKGTGDIADAVRATKKMLQDLLPTFDKTITEGAPRFQEYLKEWHERSLPIDRQEFLQQYQTGTKKLTDADGYLQPTKVQKMLDDIYQGNIARGANSAKSLTEQQIQNVVNVRNELAAQRLRDRLAAVRGSDTFQQINRAAENKQGPLGMAVRGTAEAAGHALMMSHPLFAGYGNAALGYYQGVMRPAMRQAKANRMAAEAAADIAARKQELLQTNPLQQGP